MNSAEIVAPLLDRLVVAYARGPEHPFKRRLLGWITRAIGRRILTRCDFGWMDLDVSDLIQSIMFMRGAFEAETLKLVRSLVEPGEVFLDVGANVGQFAIAVASDGGRAVAFEPNPPICAELLRNRALNRLEDRMAVVAAGVSESPRLAKFGIPWPGNRGTSREQNEGDGVRVVLRPLSEMCQELGIEKIKAAKVDVEGGELPVIRSIIKSGSMCPDHIIFEYLPDNFSYADGKDELLSLLIENGYELLNVRGAKIGEGVALPDGNIWARRGAQKK